jgi:F0F1-type ATP synthase membrane subunit b/b'
MFWGSVLISTALTVVVIYLLTKYASALEDLNKLKIHDRRHEKAEDIVGEAQDQSTEIVADFKEKLTHVTANLELEAQKALLEQVAVFKTELTNEAKKASAETTAQIANSFEGVETELEDYKRARMTQIDAEVQKMITPIAKEILGRSISDSEQEEVVKRMLTKYGQST